MDNDPKTGVSQIHSAQNSLAVNALKNGDESEFRSHAKEMIEIVLDGFANHGVPVHPEKQVPLLFIATSIGEFDLATQLAEIDPVVKHSHSFDIALVGALRAAILGHDPPVRRYNPTKSECGLFTSIASIGVSSFTIEGADAYWRATQNRSYSQTLFQHRNLFSEGIIQIHNRAEQDSAHQPTTR